MRHFSIIILAIKIFLFTDLIINFFPLLVGGVRFSDGTSPGAPVSFSRWKICRLCTFVWRYSLSCENRVSRIRRIFSKFQLRERLREYTVRPISFWDYASKTTKKIPKNSKYISLFKVIAINCNTLVGMIFQPMHCSQKISNRNSLQFRCYRCLNVAYGCISFPLQLHFQLRKRKIVGQTQIRRVWGWLCPYSPLSSCN